MPADQPQNSDSRSDPGFGAARIDRILVNEHQRYVLDCLGVGEEQLLPALTGPGAFKELDASRQYCMVEGVLPDKRVVFAHGFLRDRALALVFVHVREADREPGIS